LNPAAGLSGMLKSGHTHIEGVDGAVVRNIEAAKELSRIVSTSLGPNGMNKLVVTHLEKIIVTSDCATIVKELEIEHPAAKMLQLAAQTQDEECGDGTNLAVSFAGELLSHTEELLRSGLHPSEVVVGYRRAGEKLQEILPTLVSPAHTITQEEILDEEKLAAILSPVLAAKQHGSEDILAPIVARACIGTLPANTTRPSISPESVRVAKIMGGDVSQSTVIHGYVAMRGVETTLTKVENAKITVFGCGIEASATEAKGTVLMNNADDLIGYNKSEEKKMEEIIKSIADTGTNVVICGGTVSEMALHFIERYNMMCLKISSKWELRRFCSSTGSSALVRLGPATPDEMGYCQSAAVEEIGGRLVTIFRQEQSSNSSRLSTILLRASTSNVLADLERAVDDGVHAAKMICKDARLVPGAGATEMELAVQIRKFADSSPGLDQYAIRAFARALEFVPRTLAENAGLDGPILLAGLSAAHANGHKGAGVNVEGLMQDIANSSGRDSASIGIHEQTPIMDILATKLNAFRLAIDATLTILKVDQIIMSKPAGGGRK